MPHEPCDPPPPHQLRTLGRLALKGPDGNELHSVLQQPKRLGLLVYLAAAAPGGFCRRDSLLALFWPEQDEAHARNALNQTVYRLRRSLGEGVLVGRGDDELGLDPGRFWCDVAAFEAHVAAGRGAEALELYRGDFLEGFHVMDAAPELEHWVSRERSRLRDLAARTAWGLSEAAERQGSGVVAVHWARRAVELAPDDEAALRRLIGLLHRCGDRAGAIQAYEKFARVLAETYELEPTEETRALVETVRAREVASDERPGPLLELGSLRPEAVRPLPEPPTLPAGIPAAGTVSARGIRRRVAVLTLLALLLAAGWAAAKLERDHVTATRSANTLAVFPFAVRGDARFRYLAEGMVDLLSTNLDGAGDLRTVDPHAVVRRFYQRDGASEEVAEELGARFYVLGSVVGAAGKLRVQARLYDRERGVDSLLSVAGDTSQLFGMVDRLTLQILAAQRRSPGDRLTRLAARTTTSLPALRAYLTGESAYRRGRYQEAVEHFQEATRADSTFALAYYSLARASHWGNEFDLVHAAADRARRNATRLVEADRALVDAFTDYLRGNGAEAEQQYRAILHDDPSNVEAWFSLGHVLFHHNAARGRPFTESRTAFERAYALNPENSEALTHLIEIAGWERDALRMDTLLARLPAESDQSLPMRAIRTFVAGGAEERRRLVSEALAAGDDAASSVVSHIAFFAQEPGAAAQLAQSLAQPRRAAHLLARNRLRLAQLLAARGQLRAARRELQATAALAPATALQHEALLLSLPFLPTSPAELRAVRARLEAWDPAAVHPGDSAVSPKLVPLYPEVRSYLLGLVSAALGDGAGAERYAGELERPHSSPERTHLRADLARGVRARLARTHGKAAEALRTLEGAHLAAPWEFARSSPFHSRANERYLHALLLDELGRREALAWYASPADHSLFDAVHFAPTYLARARLLERWGRREAAIRHYERFLKLWEECDPELRPLLLDGRAGLARLRAQAAHL